MAGAPVGKLGKEVFIVCRKNGKGPFRDKVNGISVFRLPVIWWPLISWLSLLVTSLPLLLFKIRRIGVLQGFMLSVPSYLALVYGRLFRKPVVIKLSAGGKGGNVAVHAFPGKQIGPPVIFGGEGGGGERERELAGRSACKLVACCIHRAAVP